MNLLEIPAEKQQEILNQGTRRHKGESGDANPDLRSLEPVAEEEAFDPLESVDERLAKKTTEVVDVKETYFHGDGPGVLQKYNSGLASTLKSPSKKDDMSRGGNRSPMGPRGNPVEGSVVLSASELTHEKSLEDLDTQHSQPEGANPIKA